MTTVAVGPLVGVVPMVDPMEVAVEVVTLKRCNLERNCESLAGKWTV